MRFSILTTAPLAIILSLALGDAELGARVTDREATWIDISRDSLYAHMAVLGSDSLQGRGTGSAGGEKAASYIARQLQRLGLIPMGDNGGYLQAIPMHGSIPQAESELILYSNAVATRLKYGEDYLLYKSGAQTFVPEELHLVFVGYGIIAPEYDYNDYQLVDPRDKIVVFLSGEPGSDDPRYFNADEPTVYSSPESKQRIAISRGARGSIMIPVAEGGEKDWQRRVNEFSFEDVTLAYSVTSHLSVIVNPETARMLFEASSFTLDDIYEMDRTHSLFSFPLTTSLLFRGDFIERDFYAHNVIGMLQGKRRKPEDSYIIISAHYDHLGIGPKVNGDGIYNGVFDNASGVAAALEIARAFVRLPERSPRSLLFLFTTGEEKGLLGASYYVDHPAVPLYKTVANVNIDEIALFDIFNDIIGIGAELSTLEEILEEVTTACNLYVSTLPAGFASYESYAASDQIAFAKAGIPAILIAEGLDYQNYSPQQALQMRIDWARDIYHTPFDDLSQPLNLEAAQQHCRFIFTFCAALARETGRIEWRPGTSFITARLQSIAEKR